MDDRSELTLANDNPVVNGRKIAPARPDSSLVESIYERTLLRIVKGELAAGSELKSTRIAADLGTSRTPVVQALQRLAADGLVTLAPNKRATVRPGADRWLIEIHELRELLEPAAAAHAASRISEDDLVRLEELARRANSQAEPGWASAAQEFDFALHLTVADCCGNFALGEALRKIWTFKRISYLASPEPMETLARAYGEHLALLEALQRRDSETSRAAMLFHLRSARALQREHNIV